VHGDGEEAVAVLLDQGLIPLPSAPMTMARSTVRSRWKMGSSASEEAPNTQTPLFFNPSIVVATLTTLATGDGRQLPPRP